MSGTYSNKGDSNAQRRADGLQRKIDKQVKWRLKVWAACELRIREYQKALEEMGYEPVEIAKPNLNNVQVLQELAEV